MAITKEITDDKIEIVGQYRNLQIRTATIIKEDGVELTRSFHRKTLSALTSTYDSDAEAWTHTDTDVSGESSEVQAVANAVWTDAVKASLRTANESSTPIV